MNFFGGDMPADKISDTLDKMIPNGLHCSRYEDDIGLVIPGDLIYKSPVMIELAEKIEAWLVASVEPALSCSNAELHAVMFRLEWLKQAFSRQHATLGIDVAAKISEEEFMKAIQASSDAANAHFFVRPSHLPVRAANNQEGNPDVPQESVSVATTQEKIQNTIVQIMNFQREVLENRKSWAQRNCVVL
jgi:hypothetical protein